MEVLRKTNKQKPRHAQESGYGFLKEQSVKVRHTQVWVWIPQRTVTLI